TTAHAAPSAHAWCVHRIEPAADQGGSGDDGPDPECAPAAARADERVAQRDGAVGAAGSGSAVSPKELTVDQLRERVEACAATPSEQDPPKDALSVVEQLLTALESGTVRAAIRRGDQWEAVPWVKRGILLGFRVGELEASDAGDVLTFVDK